jgi:hypothetical protein
MRVTHSMGAIAGALPVCRRVMPIARTVLAGLRKLDDAFWNRNRPSKQRDVHAEVELRTAIVVAVINSPSGRIAM